MKQKRKYGMGIVAAVSFMLIGLAERSEAQTVRMVADPYTAFGVGEFQETKFFLDAGSDSTIFNISIFFANSGMKVLGVPNFRGAQPSIGQAGYAGTLLGIENVISGFVASYDRPVGSQPADRYDNGAAEGRNAILLQSSAASGDTLDMALVFDLDPTTTSVTRAYIVTDPTSGSFTMDSAIAAANGGPTIPEPSSSLLLSLGAAVAFLRRKR